jgi:hypothetical protein
MADQTQRNRRPVLVVGKLNSYRSGQFFAAQKRPPRRSFRFSQRKICSPKFLLGPLETFLKFEYFVCTGCQVVRCGRRRMTDALLVPMLLKWRMWL